MADAGADLVVDEVIWNPADLADYRRRLAAHAFHAVGLFAPLEVVERRERRAATARWASPAGSTTRCTAA